MRVLLAIPVFNEQRYLRGVLQEVRKYLSDVLVVDDGSTDQTPQLLAAESGVTVIRHAENRGYGQSLIDAFGYADRHGYDWLISMDCDEQHEPGRIPEFIDTAGGGEADIVSGSRYLQETSDDDLPPPDRRRINAQITRLINEVLGLGITDAFCGYKAYRVAALRRLRLSEPGYAFPLQFWVQVARGQLRIKEIPVKLIYRDPTRHFGGALDDPSARLQHYLDVFYSELNRTGGRAGHAATARFQRGCDTRGGR